MIFLRIREKIPLRIAEWLCGVAMILIGLYLVIWPMAFQRAGLSGFEAISPVGVWVGVSLVVGSIRIIALFVNGHKPEISAPIRAACAIMGVGIFSSISAGYYSATNEYGPPLGIVLAAVLMVGDIFNTIRATSDSYDSLRRGYKPWNGSHL